MCLGRKFFDTTNALTASSQAFRKTLADTISADIASMMKPLWVLARQAVDEMEETRSIDGVKVMPPSLGTIHDHADDLHTFLSAKVNAETHMRQVESLQNFEHNNFFGCGAMLACAEDACAEGTIAHDAASCMDAVWVWSGTSSETPPVYHMDHQYFVNGTGYHQQKVWDNLAKQIVHIESNIPVWTCSEAMGAFGRNENMQPDYHNFSWHGPVDSGSVTWGNFMAGTVPIYDAEQQIKGQFSCQVLSQGIGLILTDILENGGDMTTGAEVAIVSTVGEVIGLSEAAASPWETTPLTVSQILGSSYIGKALSKIKDVCGAVCPAHQYLIDDDDNQRLVDVTPFRTQDWGMPPLNNNWCQIMSTPRENVFKSIDRALITAMVVFVSAFVGFLGAVTLLVLSLALSHRTNRAGHQEALMQDYNRVRAAASDVMALVTPMVVMSATNFLSMDTMVCMEKVRDMGLCKVLDSLKDIANFKKKGNKIILISHQWLGFKTPDTADAVQLRAMQRFVQQMVKKFDTFNVFVWLDYISIAQRHMGQEAAAVASLPVYVSQVDILAVCAPDALHSDTGAPCGLHTYSKRGWCRTEILAKVCSTGLDDMYLCAGDGLHTQPFTKDDFDRISMYVHEGDFTVQSDCEKLVLPVLGLYSLILKKDSEHMHEMKKYIGENKNRFFPDMSHSRYKHLLQNKCKHILSKKRLWGDKWKIINSDMITNLIMCYKLFHQARITYLIFCYP